MSSIAKTLLLYKTLPGDNPRYDMELLLCELLECQPAYLRTWPETELTVEQLETLHEWLARRIDGEPVAHLIGRQAFWTLDLFVSPDTLVPRQDTEVLVERALALPLPIGARVLDLGTGTGAIALSLATEKPDWKVFGCDFKASVVELAQKNADKYQLSKVDFFQSDWFEKAAGHTFDLIVSNPPYIAPKDKHLYEGDLRFEADSALVAGDKGLADIQHIVSRAPAYLNDSGWLVLEHGYDQAEAVKRLLIENGFGAVEGCQDLGGNYRISLGQYRIR